MTDDQMEARMAEHKAVNPGHEVIARQTLHMDTKEATPLSGRCSRCGEEFDATSA